MQLANKLLYVLSPFLIATVIVLSPIIVSEHFPLGPSIACADDGNCKKECTFQYHFICTTANGNTYYDYVCSDATV